MEDASFWDRIPEDIIIAIFDFLLLPTLLRTMTVSRRWHQSVISHRTYWKHITFEFSLASQRLFLARIYRSFDRPIKVDVVLQDHDLEPIIWALQQHFHQMTQLHLHVAPFWVDRVLAMLRHPAPILVSLCVNITNPGSSIQLFLPPKGFLDGHAPSLKDVLLRNILPSSTTVSQSHSEVQTDSHCPSVTSLQVFSDASPASPLTIELVSSIVRLFPALTQVILTGFSSLAFWPAEWNSLRTLVIDLYSAGADESALALPRVAWISSVAVWPTSRHIGELVISHFARDAPLRLVVHRYQKPHPRRVAKYSIDGRTLTLVGEAASSDVQGAMIHRTAHFTEGGHQSTRLMVSRISTFLETGDLISRITKIEMDNNIWRPMALLISRLSSLEEATLVLSHAEPNLVALAETAPIECPVLRTLTIRNDLGWHFGEGISKTTLEVLEMFTQTAFRGTPQPINVILKNVIIAPTVYRSDLSTFEIFT